jgi:hypothetical protein
MTRRPAYDRKPVTTRYEGIILVIEHMLASHRETIVCLT